MSAGTSNPVKATNENLAVRKNPQFSKPEGIKTNAYGKEVEIKPPKVNSDTVSEVLSRNQNCFPEFVFEKLDSPEYGTKSDAIARFTGVPVNKPDYLNDYFFIGLMRMTDKITNPHYRGKIINIYDTPNPKG